VSYVLAFVGFALLVILHEAGHFAAAKAVGMRVEKFSLFFGPFLVKWRRGETEYGIGPIPLGGFVKISGMNPRDDLPPEVVSRAYFNQPVWKRIVVILAGPAVNLLLAFLIIGGLFWANGTREPVSRVGNETKLVAPASAVLKPGDRILAADGTRGGPETIRRVIGSHRCAGAQKDGCAAAVPVRLRIERNGTEKTVAVRPRYNAAQKRMLVGFGFALKTQPAGPLRASGLAIDQMATITTRTLGVVVRIFEPEQRKQLSSVVGAYKVTQEEFSFSVTRAVFVLGFISLSLAIINLFPFLPLDGGHVFWALAEKVRGKRIPFAVMERASVIGFALVLMVFFIGLSNDIGRLTGEGFNVQR
jgi:regulator of sigma E protease